MRLIGYLLLIGIGAVAASYFPLTPFLPAKATVMSAIEDNAPFLADWLPEDVATEPEEATETLADSGIGDEESTPSAADESKSENPDDQIWHDFPLDDVQALLIEIDVTPELVEEEDGSSYISATRANGYSFFLNPRLCEENANCLGLNIYSVFDTNTSAEQLTTLNERYAYMKFYSTANNELILQKYITADYGIARGNIKINLVTYLDILDSFEDVLNE